MEKINAVRRDINRAKATLIGRANVKGIYENFGDAEIRKIKDKYNYKSLAGGKIDDRDIINLIQSFENWCMNFDLSQF